MLWWIGASRSRIFVETTSASNYVAWYGKHDDYHSEDRSGAFDEMADDVDDDESGATYDHWFATEEFKTFAVEVFALFFGGITPNFYYWRVFEC